MSKNNNKYSANTSGGGQKKNSSKRILRIILVVLVIGVLIAGWIKGWIGVDDNGRFYLLRNPFENTVGNTVKDPDPPANTQTPSSGTEDSGPKHYSQDVISSLKNTDIFDDGTLEHIFMGTVNSSNKGSGYHYDMISGSPGEIIEGSRSEPDRNGVYTADVQVNGRKKDHYSTFYPDSWTPQQVVDAINEARTEALKTGQKDGSYYVGHGGGLRIDLYLDKNNKVVTAFPIYNGE